MGILSELYDYVKDPWEIALAAVMIRARHLLLAVALRWKTVVKAVQNERACRRTAIFSIKEHEVQTGWFPSVPAGTLKILLENNWKSIGTLHFVEFHLKTLEFQMENSFVPEFHLDAE